MRNINSSVFILVFFSYINFDFCKQPNTETIRSLMVLYSLPVVERDGSLLENQSYFSVYYYRDLILFQFRSAYNSFSNDSLIKSEYRDNFFAYKKHSRYGFTYDQHNIRNHNKKLLVDSLLERRAFQNFKWHLVADTPIFKRTTFYFDLKKKILQETYIASGDKGLSDNDTIFFYYDRKLKDVEFSLSKVLDSMKNMKLYKIRLVQASSYSEEHKITLPKREMWIEFKEVPVKNYAQTLNYFKTYEKIIENDSTRN